MSILWQATYNRPFNNRILKFHQIIINIQYYTVIEKNKSGLDSPQLGTAENRVNSSELSIFLRLSFQDQNT